MKMSGDEEADGPSASISRHQSFKSGLSPSVIRNSK